VQYPEAILMVPRNPDQESPGPGGPSELPKDSLPIGGDSSPITARFLDDILGAFSEYAIFVLDAKGRILYANPGVETVYGYENAEVLGRWGKEILETPSLEEMDALEDLLSRSDESQKLEFDLPQKRKNGEVFPARVRFHPCHHDPEASIVVVTELETQADIEQLKRDFLSIVSHELRTPLTSIRGATSMFQTGGLGTVSPEQQQFLSIIGRNCERLSHLIVNLLDLTRLEAGRLRLRLAPVNVDKLLREVARLVAEQYAEKKIQLEHAQCTDLVHAQADAVRLEQILFCLLDNAFKFTPSKGRVRTAVTATDQEVRIEVSDTGIGIALQDQNRIFEKFYQVDASLTRVAGGSGLGLYMVRKLAKMHRGRVWVKSAPSQGSTFYVALPRTPKWNRRVQPAKTNLG
jgi:PAS domain S-box-containing protein